MRVIIKVLLIMVMVIMQCVTTWAKGSVHPVLPAIKPAQVLEKPIAKSDPVRLQEQVYAKAYAREHHGPISVTIYPGSLKSNIVRMARYFGWKKIIWQPSVDYKWVGKTRLKAQSFFNVLQKILVNYPLQAQFYQGNHVLVIVARTLK